MSSDYKTCFFTGHRVIASRYYETVKSYLREEILRKINCGVTEFISGGARGFDTLAAEQILDIRNDYTMIHLRMYLPCRDHDARWGIDEKQRCRNICSRADSVHYITDGIYEYGCMKKRNMAMVADADCGIAYMKRNMSGSSQTMRMAYDKGIDVINIAEISDGEHM